MPAGVEYRVTKDGRVIMTYDVFKNLNFKEVCKMLGIRTSVV